MLLSKLSWFFAISVLLAIAALITSQLLDSRDRERMARALTGGDPQNAPEVLRRYGCTGCHTIPSLAGADGIVGPPLEDLRARVFVAGRLNNTAENLIRFVVSPRATVPGTAMPDSGIKQNEARDVVAYLYAH